MITNWNTAKAPGTAVKMPLYPAFLTLYSPFPHNCTQTSSQWRLWRLAAVGENPKLPPKARGSSLIVIPASVWGLCNQATYDKYHA